MFLIFFCVSLVIIALLLGLLSMVAGPRFRARYGIKLMSLRVVFQTITILALILTYFL